MLCIKNVQGCMKLIWLYASSDLRSEFLVGSIEHKHTCQFNENSQISINDVVFYWQIL